MLLKWGAKGKMKTNKLEFYEAHLFPDYAYDAIRGNKFRVRVNGKWFYGNNKQKYFYTSEVRDLMWRQIPFY